MNQMTGPPDLGGPLASLAPYAATPFQLALPGFEGSVELLLRRTEQQRLDISSVSLVSVVQQYLEHLRSQRATDAVELADFVAIAARLLLLKSRRLLPRPAPEQLEDDEHPEDLAAAVREYARYRAAAVSIDERRWSVGQLYPRAVAATLRPEQAAVQMPVERLLLALRDVLSRMEAQQPVGALPARPISIAERIAEVLGELRIAKVAGFFALIGRCTSRVDVLVSFLAILHLIRDGTVIADQPVPFGEILLSMAESQAASAAPG